MLNHEVAAQEPHASYYYCTEELKDQDLFSDNDEDEDMELDGNNSDEGAPYNDFDCNDSVQLMSIDEIATYKFSQDKLKSTVDKAEESAHLSVVLKKVLDELFMNMDELEPKRWWNPHGMFQGLMGVIPSKEDQVEFQHTYN